MEEPTFPSAVRPATVWNAFTAFAVLLPYWPSTVTDGTWGQRVCTPFSQVCTWAESGPEEPFLKTVPK